MFAQDTALEHCSQTAGFCKVVYMNGEFQETAFLEVAKQLAAQSVSAVRRTYLQTIAEDYPPPPPTPYVNFGSPPGSGFPLVRK
jgi:hypothetical protein